MAKVQTWVLQHPWIFDLVRGVLSLLLGLGAFIWRDHIVVILSLGIGLYLIVDGAMDIVTSYRAARAREGGQTHFLIGLFSVTVGVAAIFLQSVLFLLAFIYIGIRTLIHGLTDLWHWFSARRDQSDPDAEVKRNLWLPGLARVLVGVAVLVAAYPLFKVFAFYLAAYFVIDGIIFLVNAANKAGLIHIGRVSTPAEMAAAATATSSVGDLTTEGKGLRAVVAVRRNGAMGMGHVGWAFEWPTGWFNAGSVENRIGGAYEPPGKTDFWSVHTQTPLASLFEFGPTYDEFKVFNVPAPQAERRLEDGRLGQPPALCRPASQLLRRGVRHPAHLRRGQHPQHDTEGLPQRVVRLPARRVLPHRRSHRDSPAPRQDRAPGPDRRADPSTPDPPDDSRARRRRDTTLAPGRRAWFLRDESAAGAHQRTDRRCDRRCGACDRSRVPWWKIRDACRAGCDASGIASMTTAHPAQGLLGKA